MTAILAIDQGTTGTTALVLGEDGAPLGGMRRQEMTVEEIDHLFSAARAGLVLHSQLVTERGEEFLRAEDGVQDQRDVDALRESLEQKAAHGRLARADLAGELHEAAVLLDAVEEMREGLLMARTEIDERRIGGVGERPLVETEVCEVHLRRRSSA